MRVGIALGSNLGDRASHLRAAVAAIGKLAEPPILVSRVYETAPVDCPADSPPFLNAAMEIGYSGDLPVLLEQLQAIERVQGRPEIHGRNTPRTVDLDLLYADDLTLETLALKLPHPRMSVRPFVLFPLNDIIPKQKLPGTELTCAEHVKTLDISECKVTEYVIDEIDN